ncbi:hypothetical protein GCM10023258_23760 [Terrabacter aeriphilus]|uniref:Uncharacterized protein n=1 Tax=Terrabacter aeriphilus TaxID=515662 RepID=A0ABP9JDV8_9MICO
MHDESGIGDLDVDHIHVPPAFDRSVEDGRPRQLYALVEQEIAAIDGAPAANLVLRKDRHVVGDDLVDLATQAPLTRAMED